jgi:microcystin degradation protein MlrC
VAFSSRFGGKAGPASGVPVDGAGGGQLDGDSAEARLLAEFRPNQVPLGDRAAIRAGGIRIIPVTDDAKVLGLSTGPETVG